MSKTKTLLIVDDSRIARLMIRNIVTDKQPDWKILEAGNAEEALQRARDNKIDLFTVDLNMPGINGLELIAKLKESYPAAPMALFTANTQESIQARSKELDITCINKPVTEQSIGLLLQVFA